MTVLVALPPLTTQACLLLPLLHHRATMVAVDGSLMAPLVIQKASLGVAVPSMATAAQMKKVRLLALCVFYETLVMYLIIGTLGCSCLQDCQSECWDDCSAPSSPPRDDGRCGWEFDGAVCDPHGEFGGCCSQYGYCGSDEASKFVSLL